MLLHFLVWYSRFCQSYITSPNISHEEINRLVWLGIGRIIRRRTGWRHPELAASRIGGIQNWWHPQQAPTIHPKCSKNGLLSEWLQKQLLPKLEDQFWLPALLHFYSLQFWHLASPICLHSCSWELSPRRESISGDRVLDGINLGRRRMLYKEIWLLGDYTWENFTDIRICPTQHISIF